MTPLEELQKAHGEALSRFIRHPSFAAAVDFLNAEKIARITVMEDDAMQKNGLLTLADLRGHLQAFHGLQILHERREFEFGGDPLPDYPSPEEEAEEAPPTKRRKKK